MPNENHHAVYATCYAYNGLRLTFRVGLPVGWHRAQNRWNRLDTLRRSGHALRIRHGRRWYRVDFHGRGLGSERHALAFPIRYRELSK